MAIRRIRPEDIPRFSIDDDKNFLYWDDRIIHTGEAVLSLSTRQGIVAILAAIFTILGGTATSIYTWYYVTDYYTKKSQKEVTTSISEVVTEIKSLSNKLEANSTSSSSIPLTIDPEIKHSLTDISDSLQAIRDKLAEPLPRPIPTPSRQLPGHK